MEVGANALGLGSESFYVLIRDSAQFRLRARWNSAPDGLLGYPHVACCPAILESPTAIPRILRSHPMSSNALPAGTILERNLEVLRILGEGGFGITYLVHDHDLQQDLVLKEFFPPAWARRFGESVLAMENEEAQQCFEHFLKRFLDEARVAARVDHPNLVKVNRFFPANGTGYFVMAWHEGETLQDLLKRQPKMTPTDAMRLVLPLLEGLQQLHIAGLIHRDIKPSNIYIRSNGSPLLLDFGAARAPASSSASRPLTAVLSPGYAPPEQYSIDGIQGPHTDVYAVGAVLYRMLTGLEPVDAATRNAGANATRRHRPCIEAAPTEVPHALSEVVERAMAMNIADRIVDAPSLRRELQVALTPTMANSTTIHLHKSPQLPPKRQAPRIAFLVATAAFVIGAVGIGLWLHDSASQLELILSGHTQASSPAQTETAPSSDGIDTGATTAMPVSNPPPPTDAPPVVATEAAEGDSTEALPPTKEMVRRVRDSLPTGDLAVTVMLDPPRTKYLEGEHISIGFSTREDAYAAVFVYSQDGGVTMLYPNDYAKGKLLKANVVNWIGGNDQKFRIQVTPPFGTDIVHVVAFRNVEDFKLLLDMLDIDKATKELFIVNRASLTRSVHTIRARGLIPVSNGTEARSSMVKRGWGDAATELTTQAR